MSEQEQPAPAWVTVAEAATWLGIDESGLRKLLKRPRNAGRIAGQTQERTQVTKTGTRVATIYPFALVAELVNESRPSQAPYLVEEPTTEDAGRTQEETQDQSRDEAGTDAGNAGATGDGVFAIPDERTRVYLALLTKSYTDRIAEQDRALREQSETISDLRSDKARLLEENERLKAIPASSGSEQIVPQERVEAPETNETGASGEPSNTGESDENSSLKKGSAEVTKPARPWWKVWGRD